MLEVNIFKVLLDILKDQPTVEKVADLLTCVLPGFLTVFVKYSNKKFKKIAITRH